MGSGFTPDGRLFAYCTTYNVPAAIDLSHGLQHAQPVQFGGAEGSRQIEMQVVGHQAITLGFDGIPRTWDLSHPATGAFPVEWPAGKYPVIAMASADQQRALITLDKQGALRKTTLETPALLAAARANAGRALTKLERQRYLVPEQPAEAADESKTLSSDMQRQRAPVADQQLLSRYIEPREMQIDGLAARTELWSLPAGEHFATFYLSSYFPVSRLVVSDIDNAQELAVVEAEQLKVLEPAFIGGTHHAYRRLVVPFRLTLPHRVGITILHQRTAGRSHAVEISSPVDSFSDWALVFWPVQNSVGEGPPVNWSALVTKAPQTIRKERFIDFTWPKTAPVTGVTSESFVVQARTTVSLPAGKQLIRVLADNGVRVFIDDQSVIDDWKVGGPIERSATAVLAAGKHDIRIDYFHAPGDAVLKFHVAPLPVTEGKPPTGSAEQS